MNERVIKTTKSNKDTQASNTLKPDLKHPAESPIGKVMHLQKTIGNKAVGQLFKAGIIQAKLGINQPHDPYEQEADRLADQVMKMPDQQVQCQEIPEEDEVKTIKAKELPGNQPEITQDIENRIHSLKGNGNPLSLSDQAFFETEGYKSPL